MKSILVPVFFCFFSVFAGDSLQTVATTSIGSLLFQKDSSYLLLKNKRIEYPVKFPYSFSPQYLGKFSQNVEPYSEIIIIQDALVGTACSNLGNIYFLGIDKSGTASILRDSIEVCGQTPVVNSNECKIVIPALSTYPSATWQFKDGKFIAIKSTPPLTVTYRQAMLSSSYVVNIKNQSADSLNLWIQAKGKKSTYSMAGLQTIEFGWAEGYRFDANNLFIIGAKGYDTLRYVMPPEELSPWRISFPNEGGLSISISKSFLQDLASSKIKLPITKSFSKYLSFSLNQVPEIVLKESSDKIFANAVLQTSILSTDVNIPIFINVSFIPFYTPSTGQLGISQIKIEKLDIGVLPKQYLDAATQIVNELLPAVFSSYVLKQLDINDKKIADLINVRSIKVIDGRLEVFIL